MVCSSILNRNFGLVSSIIIQETNTHVYDKIYWGFQTSKYVPNIAIAKNYFQFYLPAICDSASKFIDLYLFIIRHSDLSIFWIYQIAIKNYTVYNFQRHFFPKISMLHLFLVTAYIRFHSLCILSVQRKHNSGKQRHLGHCFHVVALILYGKNNRSVKPRAYKNINRKI